MKITAQILLLFNGIAFALTAVFAILFPSNLFNVIHFTVDNPFGFSEFLASFGGMYLAYGLYLIWATFNRKILLQALLILTVLSFGLALGRLFSLVLYGMPNNQQLLFWLWELATAVIGLIVFNKLQALFKNN